MSEIYHIRAKKEYAVALIELLKKDGAIEDVELPEFELSEKQKQAIEDELLLVANNPDYLISWEDVKHRYKKH